MCHVILGAHLGTGTHRRSDSSALTMHSSVHVHSEDALCDMNQAILEPLLNVFWRSDGQKVK